MALIDESLESQTYEYPYYVSIIKWDEYGIDLKFNFTEPLDVSRGEFNDRLELEILYTDLFQSIQSGVTLDPLLAKFNSQIPS